MNDVDVLLEEKLDVDFGKVLLKPFACDSIRDPCIATLGIRFSLMKSDGKCHFVPGVVLLDFMIVVLLLLVMLYK
jgi:hypothetical protein